MGRIRLDMLSTSSIARSFPVRESGMTIGRSVRSDVRIALPSIAPAHARIECAEGRYIVRPCEPGASVVVNGEEAPVSGCLIKPGDVLSIGPVTFNVADRALVNAAIEVKDPHAEETHRFPAGLEKGV